MFFVAARSEIDLYHPERSERQLVLIVEGPVIKKNYIQSQRFLNKEEVLQDLLWKKPLHLKYWVYLDKIQNPTNQYRIDNNYEFIEAIESVFDNKNNYVRKGNISRYFLCHFKY